MVKKKTKKKDGAKVSVKKSDIKLFLQESYYIVMYNILLFVGIIFTFSSFLSFDHHRYCDGGVVLTDHYSCTNSAVYYEYDTTTIVLFITGVLLIAFWYLRRNTQIYYGE